jgi:hypothetical protein
MPLPTVSVIVPAYNNAEFLGETIQSVLDQSYRQFELVIVNDASPDHVDAVVKQFEDARIRYIVHPVNRGLSAARNTGIRASTGDMIALLDGDDLFLPDKLRMHVEFLEGHPGVGVSYNSRFELDHSARTIRELWRPPLTVGLADLVCCFPFSPSDMILRREWAFRVNLFDEHHVYVGEDLDINVRLAIAGCTFANVDKALNYRRYHSGRIMRNLRGVVSDTLRPLDAVFADPRCPDAIRNQKDVAYATHLVLWSAIAFGQGDTAIGQDFCREAVRRNPKLLAGQPSPLMEAMISNSIVDESVDHDPLLRSMLDQLPPEAAWPREQYDWAVARGYLLRGTRTTFWGREERGGEHFARAAALGARIDEAYLGRLTAQLLDYEAECGSEAAQAVLNKLSPHLSALGNRFEVRRLKGTYSINQAFQNYRAGNYAKVPGTVISAAANDPKYLANRGALSIFFRSLMETAKRP